MPAPDDEKFENYLKEFRPLATEPLPVKDPRPARRPLLFLAWSAATAAAASLITVLAIHHSPAVIDPPQARVVKIEQPLTISSANTRMSRAPSVKEALDQMAFPSGNVEVSIGKQSALDVLSKESIWP